MQPSEADAGDSAARFGRRAATVVHPTRERGEGGGARVNPGEVESTGTGMRTSNPPEERARLAVLRNAARRLGEGVHKFVRGAVQSLEVIVRGPGA
jgi:hypothetical protein